MKKTVALILFFIMMIFPYSLVSANDGFTAPEGPTQATFDGLNPLKTEGTEGVSDKLSTPGGIINQILVFAFPIAGLILFVMLLWAGFEMLSGAATKKSLDAGRQRATAAIIGFGLLFVSYWVVKIIEVVFGIKIF